MYSSAIRINPNELLNTLVPRAGARAQSRINRHEYPLANARGVGHTKQSLFRHARTNWMFARSAELPSQGKYRSRATCRSIPVARFLHPATFDRQLNPQTGRLFRVLGGTALSNSEFTRIRRIFCSLLNCFNIKWQLSLLQTLNEYFSFTFFHGSFFSRFIFLSWGEAIRW